jgi:hypothetical protein
LLDWRRDRGGNIEVHTRQGTPFKLTDLKKARRAWAFLIPLNASARLLVLGAGGRGSLRQVPAVDRLLTAVQRRLTAR